MNAALGPPGKVGAGTQRAPATTHQHPSHRPSQDPKLNPSLKQGSRLRLRDAALDLAAKGVDVLPCQWMAGEWAKAPLLPPPGFHLATTDPVQIRVWWTRWPRALIGAVIPSGVVVLDLDPRHGGTLDTLHALLGPLPETLTVMSGRGDGGRHLYFRRPDGPLKCNPAPWLDVKVNGYVIVPPSLHPDSGKPYRWIKRPVVDLPERAVQALRRPPCRPLPRSITSEGIDHQADALIRAVANAPEGRRNHLLYWAACRALEEGHAVGVLEELSAVAQTIGLDPREIRRTMQSAERRVTA